MAFGVYSFAIGLLTNLIGGLQYLRASNQTNNILRNHNLFLLIVLWGTGVVISLYSGIPQAVSYIVLSLFSLLYISP